jgi:hypothetical protein
MSFVKVNHWAAYSQESPVTLCGDKFPFHKQVADDEWNVLILVARNRPLRVKCNGKSPTMEPPTRHLPRGYMLRTRDIKSIRMYLWNQYRFSHILRKLLLTSRHSATPPDGVKFSAMQVEPLFSALKILSKWPLITLYAVPKFDRHIEKYVPWNISHSI